MKTITKLIFSCIFILLYTNFAWSKELDVPFHPQHTPVWCWAATIAMVGEYMTGQKAEDCEVLSAYDQALGGFGTCCQNPQPCNRTGQVQEMKIILGNLYGLSGYHYNKPLSYTDLKNEIDNGRPMIAALQKNFSGHVVVIVGYSPPQNIIILDPMSGRHEVPYQQVRANFQTGHWSQTLTVENSSVASGASPSSQGYPSGYGMKPCGCWGPNPVPVEYEPQCASQKVRVNVCAGWCAPGHPVYAYVCQ